jgi:hypothetical protein
MKYGFVYIWFDTKRKKYYIGSHMGSKDDGYVCSNKIMNCKYKSRPETFRRRILFDGMLSSHRELLDEEQKWLSMIDDSELHGVKYYNSKKVAAGGDIVSTLSPEDKALHRERSIAVLHRPETVAARLEFVNSLTPEERSERGRYARSKVKNHRGGSMPGEKNSFFGKKHSEESRKKMSDRLKGRKGTRLKEYLITFADGTQELHEGQDSIAKKYCKESPLKFARFIDTGTPIKSKRKTSKNNKLIGTFIETYESIEARIQ